MLFRDKSFQYSYVLGCSSTPSQIPTPPTVLELQNSPCISAYYIFFWVNSVRVLNKKMNLLLTCIILPRFCSTLHYPKYSKELSWELSLFIINQLNLNLSPGQWTPSVIHGQSWELQSSPGENLWPCSIWCHLHEYLLLFWSPSCPAASIICWSNQVESCILLLCLLLLCPLQNMDFVAPPEDTNWRTLFAA